jgi:small subunit ribosomal protein S2
MPRKKKTEQPEKEKEAEKVAVSDEGKKKLLERAKQLEGNIEEKIKVEEVKIIETKPEQKDIKLFFPLEDYVKAGIHLGTRVISGDMRDYVYRRRADGLAILNTNIIDKKLQEAVDLISTYTPKDVILVCKREAGWKAAQKFAEATGIKVFTKKYPAGITTNPALQDFFEPSLVIISDPWLDKNALADAKNIHIPVVGLCDTNNLTKKIDYVIPCNNKSSKSLGLVYYILAKEYCKKHSLAFNAELKDFAGEEIEDNN